MPDSDRRRYQLLNDDSSRMYPAKTGNQSLFTIRESANSGTNLEKYPLKKKKMKRRAGGQSVNLGFGSSGSLAPDTDRDTTHKGPFAKHLKGIGNNLNQYGIEAEKMKKIL